MASPLLFDNQDDFVTATLNKLQSKEKLSWVDLSTDLQDFFYTRMIVGRGNKKGRKYAQAAASGPNLEWEIQTKNDDNFADDELFGSDSTSATDLLIKATVPWTLQTTNFTYDRRESMFQGPMEKIVDILRVRRHSMFTNFYEKMEERMWTAPATSTDDPRKPYGIPLWIQQSTTAAFGFNGVDPASGWAAGVGNVLSSTYPKWANGTYTYTSVNQTSFVKKTVEACKKCRFKAPHKFNELGGADKDPKYELFTTWDVASEYDDLTTASNENLMMDAAKYRGGGDFVIKGVPGHYVPALSESDSAAVDTNDPIYGINWETMCWKFNKALNHHIDPPIQHATKHNVRVVHMDNGGNFICYNRRANFVGRRAA